MTYLKGFRALKITNNCLKKKKHVIQIKKFQQVPSKPWKLLPERVPTTPEQQPPQQSPGQSLQTKGKIPKEAQLRVSTINIEETFNLRRHCVSFIGVKLNKYYKNWKRYTKDHHILSIIKQRLKIDFSEVPFQSGYRIHLRSVQESNNLLAEVRKLLGKGVIVKSKPEFGDYISGVFKRQDR